ncbi:hypothetical protein [Kibdelosporangium phytohabitans]|uniref:hypothetical protein n=1 Tax=Kibdelosporangium phytohabitans TaxID=860235 RepID=UPI0012FB4DB2|nr:hypothetical protein [Kibdelosporangium phytohabitans]MBE1468077.1 hypothetical protein [Kibdelosporangium phytohabitans]
MNEPTAGPCRCCGRVMVHQPTYNRDHSWRDRGYVRVGGRGLCGACHTRHRRHGTLRRFPRRVVCPRRPLPPVELARLRVMVGLPALEAS